MSAADRPNQYVAEPHVATSSVGKVGIDFGFVANQIVVLNDKVATVYLSLDSTSGSTAGHKMLNNDTFTIDGNIGGLSLATTATSTADTVRVSAWRF